MWFTTVAVAEATVRLMCQHEEGATVAVVAPDGKVLRMFEVEGDGKPYPEFVEQIAA